MDRWAAAERAEALIEAGRPVEALECSERVLSEAPAHGEGLAARARALRALGRSADALEALNELARAWPGSAPAQDARGVLLAEAGGLDEARAAFAAALTLDPAFARAHFGLATLGRVAPAQLAVMKALAQRPQGLDDRAAVSALRAGESL
jgi:tetratricopeptide (TPR) repeat protein